jgi:hypothetical protein
MQLFPHHFEKERKFSPWIESRIVRNFINTFLSYHEFSDREKLEKTIN